MHEASHTDSISGMIDEARELVGNPLEDLKRREERLWHKLEVEIATRGMAMAKREARTGEEHHQAIEDLRAAGREVAHAIRELTMIIRQEILLEKPDIGVDTLAAEVDSVLGERIDIHFRTHEIPKNDKQSE